MDTTCGITMQTKIQKMMFERWGETLAMDFTHNTNNLGPGIFHVETVIIDKDFTGWRVLEQLFPKATVLLCQIHAITY
ncbi:hypothetical protein F441_13386 [Phytophthora nicotianae CJ01A1]|uniref:ZSWIM1/3 RNaseH-like domain-containing protein n=2 Tax=Phytophthora nicotianae TaxID=4792 RepID=W2WLT2_PHYNI|nr:hypothetical protein L916_13031 [Phytophthora nicotianae]ETP11093.1 hypothetical protein F441_13386 [Phytophthora nicotianae CJ01A1]